MDQQKTILKKIKQLERDWLGKLQYWLNFTLTLPCQIWRIARTKNNLNIQLLYNLNIQLLYNFNVII